MTKGLIAGSTDLVLALSLGASLPGAGLIGAGALVGFLGVGVSLVMFMLVFATWGLLALGRTSRWRHSSARCWPSPFSAIPSPGSWSVPVSSWRSGYGCTLGSVMNMSTTTMLWSTTTGSGSSWGDELQRCADQFARGRGFVELA